MPSDFLSENEIAAASLGNPGGGFNAQRQQRHVWPAEPVVARAYLDQLRRADVIQAGQAQALETALDRADELLANGSDDSTTAARLETLASAFELEGNSRTGNTRSRFLALANTVEELADRLR